MAPRVSSSLLWFVTVGGSGIALSQMDTQTGLFTFFSGLFFMAGLY
ncbi:hypothetical protein DES34_103389 [Brevibacillus brevis]|nr:hypothetical protein DES34_103389 [Brevibacillus brevis]TQK74000.1 hypothetical protein FB479_102640 [Brevibacillus sp. AG162]VEF90742.1 Uncharacterised protein [Brevibacillus brevis]